MPLITATLVTLLGLNNFANDDPLIPSDYLQVSARPVPWEPRRRNPSGATRPPVCLVRLLPDHPRAVRKRVRSDMLTYAKIMIDREWPRMRHGDFVAGAAVVMMDAIDAAGTIVPANMGECNAHIATLQQLGVIHDARQRRVAINTSGVAWFEWRVLLISATCVICFCWLFGLRNARTQLLMTSTVVTIIVSILVLLFELQYPFRSDVGIGPEAWEGAVQHIHQMQSVGQMNMKM